VQTADILRRLVPDFAIVVAGFLIAEWWGVGFAIICGIVARRGTSALVVNAMVVLISMVTAMIVQGPFDQRFGFVSDRPVANLLGLLLIVAVLALVIPRGPARAVGSGR